MRVKKNTEADSLSKETKDNDERKHSPEELKRASAAAAVALERPGSPPVPAALASPASHPLILGEVWVGVVQPTASAVAAATARPDRSKSEKSRDQ